MISQLKDFFKKNEADIVLVIGVILIALLSFGGGWLMASNQFLKYSNLASAENKDKISIEEIEFKKEDPEPVETISQKAEVKEVATETEEKNSSPSKETSEENSSDPVLKSSGNCQYVGSKNSDVFHLPDCPGAKRINEENKKCFSSKNEAEKAGYRPAKNCPGI
jgi:FtsZ-interacting cell division protein ZipA